ncbi:MAG TPA: hypothetical protein PK176_11165 [Acidobacteriota bacterium]|nr:hypothetical protein [Acidobacteriota bacterium]HQM63863.1 hypothetical protein [Acidobacteriota bacterium]
MAKIDYTTVNVNSLDGFRFAGEGGADLLPAGADVRFVVPTNASGGPDEAIVLYLLAQLAAHSRRGTRTSAEGPFAQLPRR